MKKMTQVIGIFTGKDLKWMESEGGSGYWIARTDRIKSAKYVIFIRNHRETWAVKDGLGHGQAFMIGKISGCIPTKKYEGRKLIQISEYALLPNTEQFKQAWKKLTAGQRYPVAYLNTNDLLEKLDFDIAAVEWSVFNANPNAEKDSETFEKSSDLNSFDETKELSVIIAEAKEMIAHAAGIEVDKVNIQISF
ncbi:hypothetical protein [uncultured Acinetobacter sp.]|jgi:hypothetical protein|uniref:hypothetical protein n=2 Tax=Acinetobacter TaxID=469 RepID=UPI002622FD9A|nr:hypothetical protein [uncultured Acinetobacter sp.]